jgi:peptidoglycan/LPS O-acetylase OafA/YrhL
LDAQDRPVFTWVKMEYPCGDATNPLEPRSVPSIRMKKDHELAGIEILRFVCAFGVLIWHYDHFFFVGAFDGDVGAALRPTMPFHSGLWLFYEYGSLAVPFFWVISGFIFYWHYSESINSGEVGFPDFLIRRFSRLYPLHFATLIFVAVGQYIYWSRHQTTFIYSWNKPIWFASHLVFASNWFTRQPLTFNGPIWSVSIEILIYLAFFGVARAFRPSFAIALILTVAFSLAFNFLDSFINPEVFACGMYFFAGGVAQRLASRPATLPIAVLCGLFVAAALEFDLFRLNALSLVGLAMSAVIIFVKFGETVLKTLFQRLAFFGNATYASYLLHFPLQLIIVIAVDALGWDRSIFHSRSVFLGFLLLVVTLSLVTHRYFEMPGQLYLRRIGKPFSQSRARIPTA